MKHKCYWRNRLPHYKITSSWRAYTWTSMLLHCVLGGSSCLKTSAFFLFLSVGLSVVNSELMCYVRPCLKGLLAGSGPLSLSELACFPSQPGTHSETLGRPYQAQSHNTLFLAEDSLSLLKYIVWVNCGGIRVRGTSAFEISVSLNEKCHPWVFQICSVFI